MDTGDGPGETGKAQEERGNMDDKNVKIPKQVLAMAESGTPPEAKPVAQAPDVKAPAVEVLKPAEEPVESAYMPTKTAQPEAEPNYEQAHAGLPQGKLSFEQIKAIAHERLAAMYSTLRGKYDSEVPAMQRRLREVETELEARPMAAQPGTPRNLMDAIPEEQRADADPDTLAVVEQMITAAQQGAAEELAKLKRQNFLLHVGKLCPEVEQINHNPEFIAWLEQPAPFTGTTRRALLEAANRGLDAERVAEIFNAWKLEKGIHVSKPEPKDVAVPAPVRAGAGAEAEKPVYTTTQVAEFYNNVAKGRYRNNPEEFAALEAEVNAAVAEGRVIEG